MGDVMIYEVLGRYVDGFVKVILVCIVYGRVFLNGELIIFVEKFVKFIVFMYF